MLESKLFTKGQIIIPKPLRVAHNWRAGQKLIFIDTPEGILLRPASASFPTTSVDDVAGCLNYHGKAKTLEDMEAAIALGAKEFFK